MSGERWRHASECECDDDLPDGDYCTCGWISRGYLTDRAAVEAHRTHSAGLSEGGERA